MKKEDYKPLLGIVETPPENAEAYRMFVELKAIYDEQKTTIVAVCRLAACGSAGNRTRIPGRDPDQ